jgi:hypothetical protein
VGIADSMPGVQSAGIAAVTALLTGRDADASGEGIPDVIVSPSSPKFVVMSSVVRGMSVPYISL